MIKDKDILHLSKVMEESVQDNLFGLSKKFCSLWEFTLKTLDYVKDNDKKTELQERKERLYRIYVILTELHNDFFKVTKSDKWVVDFNPLL